MHLNCVKCSVLFHFCFFSLSVEDWCTGVKSKNKSHQSPMNLFTNSFFFTVVLPSNIGKLEITCFQIPSLKLFIQFCNKYFQLWIQFCNKDVHILTLPHIIFSFFKKKDFKVSLYKRSLFDVLQLWPSWQVDVVLLWAIPSVGQWEILKHV